MKTSTYTTIEEGGKAGEVTAGPEQAWQEAVRQRMELHKKVEERERYWRRGEAAVPVEPEVAALAVELAKKSQKMKFTEIRDELTRRFGRKYSPTTVMNILTKHGVRRRRDVEKVLKVESKILEGGAVGPRMLARALKLNPVLWERGGAGEGREPGEVLAQTIFPVEPVAGQGKWHMHAVVDTYGVVGFAELNEDATTEAAVSFLDRRVLPWYEERGVRVRRIQTTRQQIFSGWEGEHVYGVYLDLHGVEQQVIPVGRPSMNGSMARFKQVFTSEWLLPLRVNRGVPPGQSRQGRKPDTPEGFARRLERLREHLAQWLEHYNREYALQGYRNNGKTPLEFWEG
ncbi:transposase [Opitutaceae bacterium TAV4]|nr:transposase [Opitutaceae bacterium TAV4]RRJ99861.1 transposase [Opitutaceae bacterium TAV3]